MLALLALAVGFAVWWSQAERRAEAEATPTPAPDPIWQLTPQQVVGVQIVGSEQGTTIRARRDAERGWRLLEPQSEDLMADPGRLERAVTGLIVLRPVEVLEGVSLGDYGLDDPPYRVTLSLQDGTERSLHIGRQAPTGDVYYANRPGESEVYLLQAFTVQEVTELVSSPPVVTPTVEGATPATSGTE